MGTLYYGDNLDILRRYLDDESVDLVYLDPPFNSAQNYNAFFQEKDGTAAAAQITAFEDTWEWNVEAEKTYGELIVQPGKVSEVMQAFMTFLGRNDMMAYLAMMAPRLVELRRVLKKTGSLYLHCDPTASHYLKLLLDAVFGVKNHRAEIVWKRSSAHNDAKQGRKQPGRIHDLIFFYTVSDEWTWNWQYTAYEDEHLERSYRHVEPDTGRRYFLGDITAPGGADPVKRNPHYEFLGVERYWRFSKEQMQKLYKEGRIVQTNPGTVPRQKRYLDEMPGVPIQDMWLDISPLSGQASERLGYPTQKPVALLERIIKASSNPGDVVLDPFCGCGTTIDAAEKNGRQWIGIDITYLAIALIKNRLANTYGDSIDLHTVGEPVSLADAQQLAADDKYQFQWWALGLVGARPVEEKKGADKGIDGKILLRETPTDAKAKQIIFSVKGGGVKVGDVRDLVGTVTREGALIGVLITLEAPTKPMVQEAAAAGFYESATWQKKYPKLQLLTIEDLLAGKAVERPPTVAIDETFKRAPKAKAKGHEQKELL